MLGGGRWELAKQAIEVVIQGLTTNDFIGIVAFSCVGHVLGDRTAFIRASAEVFHYNIAHAPFEILPLLSRELLLSLFALSRADISLIILAQ
jgi:hypothetical protein